MLTQLLPSLIALVTFTVASNSFYDITTSPTPIQRYYLAKSQELYADKIRKQGLDRITCLNTCDTNSQCAAAWSLPALGRGEADCWNLPFFNTTAIYALPDKSNPSDFSNYILYTKRLDSTVNRNITGIAPAVGSLPCIGAACVCPRSIPSEPN